MYLRDSSPLVVGVLMPSRTEVLLPLAVNFALIGEAMFSSVVPPLATATRPPRLGG